MLSCYAPAKINLTLHVGSPFPNGRHPLDSLTVFAGAEAADQVSVRQDQDLRLEVTGPFAAACGSAEDNLVLKAARALQTHLDIRTGAHIYLTKNLPVASGIGGGSADAAASLRLLNQLWNGPTEEAHLYDLAAQLGADIPICLYKAPALMRGEGEIIIPADLPRLLPALLVNSGATCPTGKVFSAFDHMQKAFTFEEQDLPDFAAPKDMITWLCAGRNDLQTPAISLWPEIDKVLDVLNALPGQCLTRMSGSGATCFALFETVEQAEQAGAYVRAMRPDWWCVATQLGRGA